MLQGASRAAHCASIFAGPIPTYVTTAELDAPTHTFFSQSNTGVSTPSNLWIFGDVVVYNICTFLSGKT